MLNVLKNYKGRSKSENVAGDFVGTYFAAFPTWHLTCSRFGRLGVF